MLKMEAIGSFETSILRRPTGRHIIDDILRSYRGGKLNCYMIIQILVLNSFMIFGS
jgi:hypothetical protein